MYVNTKQFTYNIIKSESTLLNCLTGASTLYLYSIFFSNMAILKSCCIVLVVIGVLASLHLLAPVANFSQFIVESIWVSDPVESGKETLSNATHAAGFYVDTPVMSQHTKQIVLQHTRQDTSIDMPGRLHELNIADVNAYEYCLLVAANTLELYHDYNFNEQEINIFVQNHPLAHDVVLNNTALLQFNGTWFDAVRFACSTEGNYADPTPARMLKLWALLAVINPHVSLDGHNYHRVTMNAFDYSNTPQPGTLVCVGPSDHNDAVAGLFTLATNSETYIDVNVETQDKISSAITTLPAVFNSIDSNAITLVIAVTQYADVLDVLNMVDSSAHTIVPVISLWGLAEEQANAVVSALPDSLARRISLFRPLHSASIPDWSSRGDSYGDARILRSFMSLMPAMLQAPNHLVVDAGSVGLGSLSLLTIDSVQKHHMAHAEPLAVSFRRLKTAHDTRSWGHRMLYTRTRVRVDTRLPPLYVPDHYMLHTGCLPKVQNQGSCGSCWSIVTADAITIASCISSVKAVNVSAQDILSCVQPRRFGCLGAVLPEALTELQVRAVAQTQCIPYVNGQPENLLTVPLTYHRQPGILPVMSCPHTQCLNGEQLKRTDIALSYALITSPYRHNQDVIQHQIMWHLSSGSPIVVGILACDDLLHWNPADGPYCPTPMATPVTGHALLLIGFKTDARGRVVWILRNSWGESWGQHGLLEAYAECFDITGEAYRIIT